MEVGSVNLTGTSGAFFTAEGGGVGGQAPALEREDPDLPGGLRELGMI